MKRLLFLCYSFAWCFGAVWRLPELEADIISLLARASPDSSSGVSARPARYPHSVVPFCGDLVYFFNVSHLCFLREQLARLGDGNEIGARWRP